MAVGISDGSATSRRRSSGCVARCQMHEPMPLQVVSMPATSSSRTRAQHVVVLEGRAVRVGLLHEVADEVVAGLLAALLHVRPEVVRHLLEAAHQRCRSR